MNKLRLPSPTLLIAVLALFMSMGGVSYGVATGFIDSREIKNRSIRELDVKRNVLTGRSIKESRLGKVPLAAKANSAESAAVAGSAANMKVLPLMRLAPSASGPDQNAAQAAATKVPIASKGALSIYAKCYADDDAGANPAVAGGIFVETAQSGAILESYGSSLDGNGGATQMLNADTTEDNRTLVDTLSFTNGAGVANATGHDQWLFSVAAPDGTVLSGQLSVATKTGSLPGGDGVYGAGPVCLVSGFVALG